MIKNNLYYLNCESGSNGSGGGSSKVEITLTGESGTLTSEQISLVNDASKNVVLVNDGQVFYLSNKQSTLTYKTFVNSDCALTDEMKFKAIFVQLDPVAVNYGMWNKENIVVTEDTSYSILKTNVNLDTDIDAKTTVPTSALEQMDIASRPHAIEAGAMVAGANNNTLGIIDSISGTNAIITTIASSPSKDWIQPYDWKEQDIDLRETTPDNSISLLAGVKSDYSAYDNLGLVATCTGGYNVFIDGVQYGETYASATQCNITWSNYSATQGKSITTPESLIAHEIHIVPATSGNNITAFRCARVASSGTEQQGVLWIHFNTNDYVNLTKCFCGDEGGVYNNKILKAVTAPQNVLNISSLYGTFDGCVILEYLPTLQSDGRVVGNYRAFNNCGSIKNISLKNMIFTELINNFRLCFQLEKIKTNNVQVNLNSFYSGNYSYYGCYKLKHILPATYTSSMQSMTGYIVDAESLQDTILDVRSATGLKVIGCHGSTAHFMTGFKGLRVSNQAPFDSTSSPQINVSYTGMDRQALVQLFNDLPTVSGTQVINITGCTGTANLTAEDEAIATEKGWGIQK